MTPNEAAAIFAIFEKADDYESLIWRVDMAAARSMKLYALCNDVFFWATADLEEITELDVPLLQECLADLGKCAEPWSDAYLPGLFAARKRKLRPQKPFYKDMPSDVAALFDACCTEEERAGADKQDAAFWVHVARTVAAKDAGEAAG